MSRLVLATPGLRAVGFTLTGEQWLENVRIRGDEPWYAEALAAALDDGPREAYAQFMYGRWDEAARAHTMIGRREQAAAEEYLATDWEPVAEATVAGLPNLRRRCS